jgi:hypothetical protein
MKKIILGDLNINLLHNLDVFDLWCGPTHQNGSLIDHIYVDDKNNYPFLPTFHSVDQIMIYVCIISIKMNSLKPGDRYISFRNLKPVDWVSFQSKLLKYEFQPELNQELANTEFWKLNNYVLHELDKVIPIKRKRVKGVVHPWFTQEVRQICHERDVAKKMTVGSQSDNDW